MQLMIRCYTEVLLRGEVVIHRGETTMRSTQREGGTRASHRKPRTKGQGHQGIHETAHQVIGMITKSKQAF